MITQVSEVRDRINALAPHARFAFLRDNWDDLRRAMPLFAPQGVNTFDAALTTQMLASGLIVALQNKLAPLAAFTRDFSIDRIKPLSAVQVPRAVSGGTAVASATNFEDTTNFVGTIDNVSITPLQYTVGAHLTNAELNSGFRLAQMVELKACEMADSLKVLVNAIITTGNFTAPVNPCVAAAFGWDELKTLWGQLKKSPIKSILLDGEYYSQFLPTTSVNFDPANSRRFGWDGFFLDTLWTGATANTVGFACGREAIAICAGLPLSPTVPSPQLTENVVTVPGLNLSVAQYTWASTATRTAWMTWDVMFGAAVGDGAAGVLIMSA